MPQSNPAGYLGNDVVAKEFQRVLFNVGQHMDAGEMNELQMILENKIEGVANEFWKPGTYLRGGKPSVTRVDSSLAVAITSGVMYAAGTLHNVPALNATITGTGLESIYLLIGKHVVDSDEDPDILDQSDGETAGEPGADRLKYTYTASTTDTSGVLIAQFQDGQVVKEPTVISTIFQEILDLIRVREWEKDGSFLTAAPRVTPFDFASVEAGPKNIGLRIEGGVGRIQGVRQVNTGVLNQPVKRPLTGANRLNEPHNFLTGTKVYTLSNNPVLTIEDMVATIQPASFQLTRGLTGGGQDAIPVQYQPTESIVQITQGATTYVEGDDYVLSGNYISWAPGGAEPSAGSSYNVILRFDTSLTKGVRTETYVASEVQAVAGAACSTTHVDLKEVVSIVDDATGLITYVEGVNYTVDLSTGDITWLVDPGSINVRIAYTYWAHTLEGDFTSRDSFVNDSGDQVLDGLPTKTPSGLTINYKTQVSFDVSGTPLVPVNSTNIRVDYTYTLGRKDILVWGKNGFFRIIEGTPGVDPKLPSVGDEDLPIIQIHLPAEAMAADVTFEKYDNLTLRVVDLRALQNTVDNILYNQVQFQLHQNMTNIPTATDKRGIFADNLSTPDLADLTHVDFACSFDFLARTIALPRTNEAKQPNMSSADATVKESMFFPTYTEQTFLEQPFYTDERIVNAYDAVNLRAKISLDRVVDSYMDQDTALIRTVHDDTTLQCAWVWNYYLVSNVTSQTELADKLGESRMDFARNNPWWYSYVPINKEWTDVLTEAEQDITLNRLDTPQDATVLTSNKWATVSQASNVVVKGDIATGEVNVTGSLFTPGERAIQVQFGDQFVDLTPTGATAAETDPKFPGTVVADGSGNFTAKFTIPDNTKSGRYQITATGRDAGDLTIKKSYATTFYQATAYLEYYGLYLQIHDDNWEKWYFYAPFAAFRETLEIPLTSGNYYAENYAKYWSGYAYYDLYYTSWQSLAHTIATGIKEAKLSGTVITEIQLTAAIAAMLAYTGLEAIVSTDHINAMANAAILDTTDVNTNVALIQAASDYAKLAISNFPKRYYDPLAQTFTPPTDLFVSSIELWFTVAPATDTVSIAICETDNGYPTNKYFAIKTLAPGSINESGSTKFTFDSPVFLKGNAEYGIVVATADTAARIKVATVGKEDVDSGNLVIRQGATGALFESPNAQAWKLIAESDMKFKINQCSFTNTQTIISTGAVNFSTARSRFAFHCPFVEINDLTRIDFQYSLDNNEWKDFSPMKEVDLGQTTNVLYIRLVLKHTNNLIPIVYNDAQLTGYIFLLSGTYTHRQWGQPSAEIRYVDMWVDVSLPGGTTVSPTVDLDEEGAASMTEVVADRIQIDQEWWEYHWAYDTGGDLKQFIRTFLAFTSASPYVTPRFRNIRVVAREG